MRLSASLLSSRGRHFARILSVTGQRKLPDMSEGDTAAAKAAYAELVRNDSGAVRWMPDATPGSEGTRLFGQLADVQELNGASRPRPTLTPQVSLMMITPFIVLFQKQTELCCFIYLRYERASEPRAVQLPWKLPLLSGFT